MWGLHGYVSVFVGVCGPWPVSICVCVTGVGVSCSGESAPFFHTPASRSGHLPLREGLDGSWPLRTAALLDGIPQELRFCVLLTPAGQAGQTPGSLNLLEAHLLLPGLAPWETEGPVLAGLGDLVEVRAGQGEHPEAGRER